jgi:hypothetical protein
MDDLDGRRQDTSMFWRLADELQDRTISHAGQLFAFAERADPRQLRSLLIQYRFFTIYYIPDIAILVARLPDGRLRSFLAGILSDELGCGDPLMAHPRLYDDFLKSLGAEGEDLDALAIKGNIELLDSARRKLIDPNVDTAYGVGLRGMGGECVCQVYLSHLYEHITKNRYVQERHAEIDWRFWELHIGDHDIAHRERTRELIDNEILSQSPAALQSIGEGYRESMRSWSAFWANVFDSVKSAQVHRTRVHATVNFLMPGDAPAGLGRTQA